MVTTLHFDIDHGPLKMQIVYEGILCQHVMFKACQYATNDEKVFVRLKHASMKDVQTRLQKIVTWTKYRG